MVYSKIDVCPIHGQTEFHFYEKTGRKGQWICLKCNSELAVLKKQKYKLLCLQYKGCKCEICGYDKNIAALEFHHLDPNEKEFTISKTHHSIDSVKDELNKCIVVCSNCHREIHNPQSTVQNINQLILQHQEKLQLKSNANKGKKYKYTLEELNNKRNELSSWQEVADFFNVSLSTIKRHKKELEMQ